MFRLISVAIILFATCSSVFANQERFIGDVVVKFLADGRNMQLVQPFGYVDSSGIEWDVPKGSETDGASVPRMLWDLFPPFAGKYREAAVIHDYFCREKTRSWQDTHRMFYEAMLTSGVSKIKAKVMYAGVYARGPRWGIGSGDRGPWGSKNVTSDDEKEFLSNVRTWIEKKDPTIEQLESYIEMGGGLPD